MEYKLYVEHQPPAVVELELRRNSTGKDRQQHRHSQSFPPLESHKVAVFSSVFAQEKLLHSLSVVLEIHILKIMQMLVGYC